MRSPVNFFRGFLTALAVVAATPALSGFLGSDEWRALSKSERHFYVIGLIDGIYFTTALEEDTPLRAQYSCLLERNLDSQQVLTLMELEYASADNIHMPPQVVLLSTLHRFCSK